MSRRMFAALVAMAGVFVALYLALFKLGYIGNLVCAVGSCEVVQTSRWATVFGVPVAVWGVAFYAAVLTVVLAGLSERFVESRQVAQILVLMTGTGVLVSLWLTYLELFVIRAICMWCVISAVLSVVLFVICLLDLRDSDDAGRAVAIQAAERLKGGGYGRGIRNTSEVSLRAVRPDE